MENRGYKTHAKVLENTIINPPQDVKQNLNLNDEEKLYWWIGSVMPMTSQLQWRSYMPAERFKSILDKDLSHMSINKIMQTEHNVIFSRQAMDWHSYLNKIPDKNIQPKPIAILIWKGLYLTYKEGLYNIHYLITGAICTNMKLYCPWRVKERKSFYKNESCHEMWRFPLILINMISPCLNGQQFFSSFAGNDASCTGWKAFLSEMI